ncbi:MAG: trans-2-enoyl-CoA reductase [Gammaproteobacteria bacterium RIFCSPLOWO2_02_FULL_42_14]|nr:MAG: trans-2-enoyl-CoA reductase [Gammaproteobacteria bacterium RIFCSPHIGHO2_02_FULL_42_43]OGT27389.1 MAG: trans-2-enoyl-CoA reductase [Gammaproteobacteria bacterium RIFCSPHIGHO2_01_FULL_42_8]OGT52296.1 MAG: trans-2-enoyl-CoA reductase [Gammaproteobacteria bacterium RIFCSPHIGHO2_12_FULL_41_25]OGT61908.1 MAG: trans-2-enoyl-CoA reductase [Gammaproteobacteria bacterium RIFCSPLOWO2_02_FULL_42_14]OGT86381.1 MAG: trans-2-enoyl-CoA reductase [Gammaproteobacteria bacterium RIFCSPLOWO2_12_FULL_42_18]
MVVEPKVRGFICTTAHPAGCYQNVMNQIQYVKSHSAIASAPKNVLVIGCSTGYGLASRIVAAYAGQAKTIGVCFEKPASDKRTATAGWYNTAAFEKIAHRDGLYAKTINGDAFSEDIKNKTIELIKKDLGNVDCVIYSLASPRRTHPKTGETFHSTLKPINQDYRNKTVDPMSGTVSEIMLEPANAEDIAHTVAVMGGEDWAMWIDALKKENVLADHAMTMAYTYVGPALTHAIYKNGTIGKAKDDLLKTARQLNEMLKKTGSRALVSVNKAVVTQASSAIPVVPLYISILFRLMKEKGTHEGCIEQMERLFRDFVYTGKPIVTDAEDRVRIDDLEMQADVQAGVEKLWSTVNTDNIQSITDIAGYRRDFYRLFGFEVDGVDYSADVNIDVKIPSVE